MGICLSNRQVERKDRVHTDEIQLAPEIYNPASRLSGAAWKNGPPDVRVIHDEDDEYGGNGQTMPINHPLKPIHKNAPSDTINSSMAGQPGSNQERVAYDQHFREVVPAEFSPRKQYAQNNRSAFNNTNSYDRNENNHSQYEPHTEPHAGVSNDRTMNNQRRDMNHRPQQQAEQLSHSTFDPVSGHFSQTDNPNRAGNPTAFQHSNQRPNAMVHDPNDRNHSSGMRGNPLPHNQQNRMNPGINPHSQQRPVQNQPYQSHGQPQQPQHVPNQSPQHSNTQNGQHQSHSGHPQMGRNYDNGGSRGPNQRQNMDNHPYGDPNTGRELQPNHSPPHKAVNQQSTTFIPPNPNMNAHVSSNEQVNRQVSSGIKSMNNPSRSGHPQREHHGQPPLNQLQRSQNSQDQWQQGPPKQSSAPSPMNRSNAHQHPNQQQSSHHHPDHRNQQNWNQKDPRNVQKSQPSHPLPNRVPSHQQPPSQQFPLKQQSHDRALPPNGGMNTNNSREQQIDGQGFGAMYSRKQPQLDHHPHSGKHTVNRNDRNGVPDDFNKQRSNNIHPNDQNQINPQKDYQNPMRPQKPMNLQNHPPSTEMLHYVPHQQPLPNRSTSNEQPAGNSFGITVPSSIYNPAKNMENRNKQKSPPFHPSSNNPVNPHQQSLPPLNAQNSPNGPNGSNHHGQPQGHPKGHPHGSNPLHPQQQSQHINPQTLHQSSLPNEPPKQLSNGSNSFGITVPSAVYNPAQKPMPVPNVRSNIGNDSGYKSYNQYNDRNRVNGVNQGNGVKPVNQQSPPLGPSVSRNNHQIQSQNANNTRNMDTNRNSGGPSPMNMNRPQNVQNAQNQQHFRNRQIANEIAKNPPRQQQQVNQQRFQPQRPMTAQPMPPYVAPHQVKPLPPSQPKPSQKPKVSPNQYPPKVAMGGGKVMQPPTRQQKQQRRAQKKAAKKKQPKSVWEVNENDVDSDDDDEWRKKSVMEAAARRKSKINYDVKPAPKRRGNMGQDDRRRKSVFDESSSDEDSSDEDDNGRRLTVNMGRAPNTSVSGFVNLAQ